MADDLSLLEHLDGLSGLRNGLRRVAEKRGDWAGIPMPLANERLVIEPTYPKAAELSAIGRDDPETPDMTDIEFRNSWWSQSKRCEVYIWSEGGRVMHSLLPPTSRVTMELSTLGCSDAWGIEQEAKAIHLLGTLVKHRAFKQYMLTGSFIETSPRSGVIYMFRKLRPTLAMRSDGERVRLLCALCMHPIAYYSDTWAGAMTPTDDVVAHLMMMRGDEAMFWRRSNQHPAHRPEAGI